MGELAAPTEIRPHKTRVPKEESCQEPEAAPSFLASVTFHYFPERTQSHVRQGGRKQLQM